jgi:hypothetical protein
VEDDEKQEEEEEGRVGGNEGVRNDLPPFFLRFVVDARVERQENNAGILEELPRPVCKDTSSR